MKRCKWSCVLGGIWWSLGFLLLLFLASLCHLWLVLWRTSELVLSCHFSCCIAKQSILSVILIFCSCCLGWRWKTRPQLNLDKACTMSCGTRSQLWVPVSTWCELLKFWQKGSFWIDAKQMLWDHPLFNAQDSQDLSKQILFFVVTVALWS